MKVSKNLSTFLLSWMAIHGLPSNSVYAIDFKIDLPPEAGRVPTELDTKNTHSALFDDSIGMEYPSDASSTASDADEGNNAYRLDLPNQSVAIPRNETGGSETANTQLRDNKNNSNNNQINGSEGKSKRETATKKKSEPKRKSIATLDRAFPAPTCLADNVAFWERVYSEADVDDAIIHDKEDLSRVFAVIKLPESPRQRSLMVDEVREHVERKLRELAALLNSPDSWDRTHHELAKLFPGQELNAQEIIRAASNLRVQTGLRSRFEDGIQRSLRYLPTIHSIIEQNHLPDDIVYLPHVESSYYPGARSKVGAVGLWQIMPGTMRLVMGRHAVRRRNEVSISTQAAARILKQNFESTGSWPLALTAYNHGLHGVMRAIKKTGSRDLCEIISNYESRSFRFASSNFYAQFLAARNVAQSRYLQLAKTEGQKTKLKRLLASISRGNL